MVAAMAALMVDSKGCSVELWDEMMAILKECTKDATKVGLSVLIWAEKKVVSMGFLKVAYSVEMRDKVLASD